MRGYSAKNAAKKGPEIPNEESRPFSVSKAMQSKPEARTERKGNPGKEQPSEQFPLRSGVAAPFNAMDPHWQGSSLDRQKQAAKFYDKGEAKQLSRRIPIGPGGSGEVVARSSDSSLSPAHYNPLAKKGMR